MSTGMSSDPSIARGDFRTSVSLNFGYWHSKPLVRASAFTGSYGRFLKKAQKAGVKRVGSFSFTEKGIRGQSKTGK